MEKEFMIMILIKSCLVICFLFLIIKDVNGQKISPYLCQKIYSDVVKKMKPIRISRKETFKRSCVFEFTIGNEIEVSIDIEIFRSNMEAQKELNNMRDFFILDDTINNTKYYKEIKIQVPWDESAIFEDYQVNSFALLRKRHFLITLFAKSSTTLFSFEQLLRKVKI